MKPPSPPAATTRSAHPRPSTAAPPPTPPSNLPKHLRKAAGAKDPNVLPAFIADHPSLTLADLDDTSYDGRGPLHMACWTGAISNVELLLERGCHINAIATRSHNYGKSPIFFACTRSREDVVHLLLNRGANVLIVNNKGQSVYSIARTHFGKEVVDKIQEVEIVQQREWSESNPGGGGLDGWVDYHKSHPDGCVYGDLDLRFLGRPLTEEDVVEDGVVNPTTKESRRGNFARNNPQAYNSRRKAKEGKATKTQPEPAIITEDERMQLEQYWESVHTALKAGDARGLSSWLLDVVEFMEAKKVRSKWVVEYSLQASISEGGSAPSWTVLMKAPPARIDGEKRHLSLPHPPTWVDSSDGLQSLRSKLNIALNGSDQTLDTDEISFERMVAFDSEFRSENGRTALATIQVSVLEEGVPLAWVVDLHPDPADAIYATSTCDFLRWLFLESNAHLLGFAHRHDLHMISSYIEEDIQASSLRLWDLQLLAAHKMSGAGGSATSLPGLKASAAYFLGAAETAWELSKAEQCSNWARRPLTASQLEYAGLDAAVLLVLVAEICRRTT